MYIVLSYYQQLSVLKIYGRVLWWLTTVSAFQFQMYFRGFLFGFFFPKNVFQGVFQSYLTLATTWTVVHKAPLSMGFSGQEYWSGLPCSPPGDLPNPGIEPVSPVTPALQVDSVPLSHWGSPKYSVLLKYISEFVFFFSKMFKLFAL